MKIIYLFSTMAAALEASRLRRAPRCPGLCAAVALSISCLLLPRVGAGAHAGAWSSVEHAANTAHAGGSPRGWGGALRLRGGVNPKMDRTPVEETVRA